MNHWQPVRAAYSAMKSSAMSPRLPKMTEGASVKNSRVKKFSSMRKGQIDPGQDAGGHEIGKEERLVGLVVAGGTRRSTSAAATSACVSLDVSTAVAIGPF